MDTTNRQSEGSRTEIEVNLSNQYLAGVFDGEGSIGINKVRPVKAYTNPRYSAKIAFGMAQKTVVEEFQIRFGGWMKLRTNQGSVRPIWNWQIAGTDCVLKFLDEIGRFLLIKREQAELLRYFIINKKIPFCRTKGTSPDEILWRESIYQRLLALNKGTAPATTERSDPATGCDSLNSQATVREESEEVLPLPRFIVKVNWQS